MLRLDNPSNCGTLKIMYFDPLGQAVNALFVGGLMDGMEQLLPDSIHHVKWAETPQPYYTDSTLDAPIYSSSVVYQNYHRVEMQNWGPDQVIFRWDMLTNEQFKTLLMSHFQQNIVFTKHDYPRFPVFEEEKPIEPFEDCLF